MTDLLTFWYMLPVAISIATIAMMFGVGGAIFFSPFFMIVLSLEPGLAISLGLFIELFGFSSGLISYGRMKLINYHLSTRIILPAIIGVIIGTIFSKIIPPFILEFLLAGVILALGLSFLVGEKEVKFVQYPLHPLCKEYSEGKAEQRDQNLKWFDFWTDFKKSPSIFLITFFGGLMVGLSSTGLGEINGYTFIKKLKMDLGKAAGSSIFIVAITALIGSLFNISYFSLTNAQDIQIIIQLAIFTIPGVVIGAQLGSQLSKRINREKSLKLLPPLFICIAIITLFKAIFSF